MQPRPRSYDADAATARLKVTKATLYAYVSRGLIASVADAADPRRRLYRAEDVERLAAKKAMGRRPERIAAATLDFGLPVLPSRITLIAEGRLFYRGRDAAALAESASFEDAARLLWDCGDIDPFADPRPVAAARPRPHPAHGGCPRPSRSRRRRDLAARAASPVAGRRASPSPPRRRRRGARALGGCGPHPARARRRPRWARRRPHPPRPRPLRRPRAQRLGLRRARRRLDGSLARGSGHGRARGAERTAPRRRHGARRGAFR